MAGLVIPQMELRAPLGGSEEWIGYEWAVESMRSVLPLLEKYDIATSDEMGLDTLGNRSHAEVIQTGYPFMLIPMVTAWANKP
jgi:hypothetical protein